MKNFFFFFLHELKLMNHFCKIRKITIDNRNRISFIERDLVRTVNEIQYTVSCIGNNLHTLVVLWIHRYCIPFIFIILPIDYFPIYCIFFVS